MTEQLETAPAEGVASPDNEPHRRGMWMFLRDVLLILLAALILSFVIKTFFIRSFYIPSPSMTNTLQVNDRVIVSLLTPGLTPLKHGDVVVFTDPGGWLPPDPLGSSAAQSPLTAALAFVGLAAPNDNNHLVKRVIGLPGDRVRCCDPLGHLEINGVPIDEPYINVPKGTPADPFKFNVVVPKGDLWVMGDNRDDSEDSAYHENKNDVSPFVPLTEVTGRAMIISWPIGRWNYLSDYPVVFQDANKGK